MNTNMDLETQDDYDSLEEFYSMEQDDSLEEYEECPSLSAYWHGETALATSPLFRDHHLLLLCNVFINKNQFVEYLVCSDKAQLLGIKVVNPLDGPQEPQTGPVPIQQISHVHMMLGEVDTLLSSLKTILSDPQKPAALPSQILEIPENLHEKMAKLYLIHKPLKFETWEPTGFGYSRNIVHGFPPQDGTESRTALFTLDGSMATLMETLDWDKTVDPFAYSEIISLRQRTEAARNGLPSNNRTASNLVQKFADTPLEEYLAQYPDSLTCLMENGEPRSYKDAASVVYGLYVQPSTMEHGKSLMEELLKPLLGADGTEPARSLAPFLNSTFATVLYGAALLSGQPFLQWKIEDIVTRFLGGKPKARMNSMGNLLQFAKQNQLTPGWEDASYDLLFSLAIEPFRLMTQADKPAS